MNREKGKNHGRDGGKRNQRERDIKFTRVCWIFFKCMTKLPIDREGGGEGR